MYIDNCPLKWEFMSGNHVLSFFKKHSSTELWLNVFIFWFFRAKFMRLLHDCFIFDVSLLEFTKFSSNYVITINNKLWIVTVTIGF